MAEVVRQGTVWAVQVSGAAPPRAAVLVGGYVAGRGRQSRGQCSAGVRQGMQSGVEWAPPVVAAPVVGWEPEVVAGFGTWGGE